MIFRALQITALSVIYYPVQLFGPSQRYVIKKYREQRLSSFFIIVFLYFHYSPESRIIGWVHLGLSAGMPVHGLPLSSDLGFLTIWQSRNLHQRAQIAERKLLSLLRTRLASQFHCTLCVKATSLPRAKWRVLYY